jgi:uncharacterized protein
VEISILFVDDRRKIRPGWRALLYLLLSTMGSAFLIFIHLAITVRIVPSAVNFPRLSPLAPYAMTCVAAVAAAYIMLRYFDDRPLGMLGYSIHNRAGLEILQGMLLGFFMVSCLTGIEWAAGFASFSWVGFDARRLTSLFSFYLVFFSVSSAMEELLTRGYAFQALVQGIGKIGAVGISAIVFSLAHLNNPHVDVTALLNTILAGVWLSLAYLKTRSLWLPTSLHMTWNLSLGFICGYPVSGAFVPDSMLKLSQRGPEWVTGGPYGPESGVLSTGILLAATLLLLRSKRIRPAEKAKALWD